MTLVSPFAWLPCPTRVWVFGVSVALTAVVMAFLAALNGQLKKCGSDKKGIIDLECVGTLKGAQCILDGWGERGRLLAGLNLGLDYLFLALYPVSISLGCVLVARGLYGRVPWLGGVGLVVAWAQYAAGLLDAVENYALIQLLLGSKRAFWPPLARWCAIPKFAIVLAGLAYFALGGPFALAWWR